MTQLLQWFEILWNSIQAGIDFFLARLEDTIYLVTLFDDMTTAIPAFLTWLPPATLAPLLTCLGVVVIFRFLGLGD